MTKPSRTFFARTPVAAGTWGFVLMLLLLAIARTWLVVVQGVASPGDFLGGIVIAIVALVPVFWLFAVRDRTRLREVQSANPGAQVLTLNLYGDALPQWEELAAATHGTFTSAWTPAHVVLSVQRGKVDVLGGPLWGVGGRRKTLASVCFDRDVDVSVAQAPQGLYVMRTIELAVMVDGVRYTVNLFPLRTVSGLLPRPLKASGIEDTANALKAIINSNARA